MLARTRDIFVTNHNDKCERTHTSCLSKELVYRGNYIYTDAQVCRLYSEGKIDEGRRRTEGQKHERKQQPIIVHVSYICFLFPRVFLDYCVMLKCFSSFFFPYITLTFIVSYIVKQLSILNYKIFQKCVEDLDAFTIQQTFLTEMEFQKR